jgi:hypothetical protein
MCTVQYAEPMGIEFFYHSFHIVKFIELKLHINIIF